MALIDNIVSYYKLEENAANTTVVDAHGANTGTASTNTSNLSTTGKIDNAFNFNGTNENVVLANENNFDLVEITISAWIKTSVKGDAVFTKGKAADFQYMLFQTAADGYAAMVGWTAAGATSIFATGTTNIADGAWHHVVGVIKDGSYARIYVDGVYEAEDTTFSGTYNTEGAAVAMIAEREDGALDWNGDIDEVGIWSRELTNGGVAVSNTAGGEIEELYNSGSGNQYPFPVAALGNSQMFGANF